MDVLTPQLAGDDDIVQLPAQAALRPIVPRGWPPVDVAAAAAVVARLSWLAADMRGRWSDAEINPQILGAAGHGICAVDVRATPAAPL